LALAIPVANAKASTHMIARPAADGSPPAGAAGRPEACSRPQNAASHPPISSRSRRDARQAREWEASSTRSYEDADSYADAQAQYRRDLADWRRAVADCRAGYYDACGR
jgi:hypothetical protein